MNLWQNNLNFYQIALCDDEIYLFFIAKMAPIQIVLFGFRMTHEFFEKLKKIFGCKPVQKKELF